MTASSSSHAEKAGYSFTWALSVVDKLCEKYPRATEIEMAVFSLSRRELAAFLAHGDRFWPFFRDQVHELDKRANTIGSWSVNIMARRRGTLDRIHTVSSLDLRERVRKRLTSLGTRTTLEEQSRKGPVEADGTPSVEAGFLLSSPAVREDAGFQYLLEFK